MKAMAEPYTELLDATIRHLEGLKERGVRFVSVSAGKSGPRWRKRRVHRPHKQPRHRGRRCTSARPMEREALVAATLIADAGRRDRRGRVKPGGEGRGVADLRARGVGMHQVPAPGEFAEERGFWRGSPDASLMFVGEAPGADEDEQASRSWGRRGSF